MPLYYVTIDSGCGIRYAKSRQQAWADLRREEGTNHTKGVRLATKEDIADVKVMGGYIPENPRPE